MGFIFDITYNYEVQPGVPIEVVRELDIPPKSFFEEEILPNFIVPGSTLIIPQPEETFTYIVENGDSLDTIANKFNVSVDEIYQLNELTNINLNIGDILLIPSKATEEKITKEITYKIKPGDTLSEIAKEYNTTVKKIIEDNNLQNKIIFANQLINIIGIKTPSFTYTVKPGDIIDEIAVNFSSTIEDIMTRNELKSKDIEVGQELVIPLTNIDIDLVYSNYTEYLVQEGDTIDSIARAFKTDPKTIIALNKLIPYVELLPDIISEISSGFVRYRVEEGDSLFAIAQKVRIPLELIVEVNPQLISNPILGIGDIIQIPVLPLRN